MTNHSNPRNIRRTGLDPPYNPLQVSTWILYPTFVTNFLVLNSAILVHYDVLTGSLVTGMFLIVAIVALYYGSVTCMTDPIDERLECHLQNKPMTSSSSDGTLKHCWVCQTSVNPRSLHCKYCQKCVAVFDHHCQWLNTCIGERNYKLFFRTVVSSFLFVGMHFAVNLFLIVGYFADFDSDKLKDSVDNVYVGGNPVVIILVIVFGVITGLVLCMIAQLLLFHLSLQRQGITTYDYIVNYNSRSLGKKRTKDAINIKRAAAISIAKGKGESTLMLHLGKICIPCDPIRKELRSENDREKRDGNNTKPTNATNSNKAGISKLVKDANELEEVNVSNIDDVVLNDIEEGSSSRKN